MKLVSKKGFFVVVFFLIYSVAFSMEIGFRLTPSGFFRYSSVQDASTGKSKLLNAWGSFLDVDVNLIDYLSFGPQFGFFSIPDTNGNLSSDLACIDVGVGVSGYYYPTSRLQLRAGLSGGYYALVFPNTYVNEETAQTETSTYMFYNPWFRVYGEVGFRFSPFLSANLNIGYLNQIFSSPEGSSIDSSAYIKQYLPVGSSLQIGASIQYLLNTQKNVNNLSAELVQLEPLYPIYYGIYKDNSFSDIVIKNTESAEIRNVTVSFRAGDYTSSLLLCGTQELVKRNETITIPLYADFSTNLMGFAENGKLQGEVVVSYTLLGEERQSVNSVVLSVYNRNSIKWLDANALAAYVAPNATEVLELSKYCVGIGRDNLRSGLNRNMQFAMYLFEGMKLGGIINQVDVSTPYIEYHLNSDLLDSIQHPSQTLTYRTGDCDEIGLLYAALLESVGINVIIIPTYDDFVVAFSTKLTTTQLDNLFDGTGKILAFGDDYYIPVAMSSLKEGFVNSWYKGVEKINAALDFEEELEYILLKDAWQSYPPAPFVLKGSDYNTPDDEELIAAVETDLTRYVTTEFSPKIRAIQQEIAQNGASIDLYNKMGMLYVRAGMYDQAVSIYERSVELNSVTACINLGNIALLRLQYTQAEKWFKEALRIEPYNTTAQKGLERVKTETAE